VKVVVGCGVVVVFEVAVEVVVVWRGRLWRRGRVGSIWEDDGSGKVPGWKL
jgi:hypothetical protein